MGEIEAEHHVTVHSLHIVDGSYQTLHRMVVKSGHSCWIHIFVFEISSKGAIFGLAAHKISGQLHVPSWVQLFEKHTIHASFAIHFSHEHESRGLHGRGNVFGDICHEGIVRLWATPSHHHLHGVLSFFLDAWVGDFPGLEDLKVFGKWEGDIEFEAFDELVFASDAENGVKQVIKAWHSSFGGGMDGWVVFICGSWWGRFYTWSWGSSVSSPSLQDTLLGSKYLVKFFRKCINIYLC